MIQRNSVLAIIPARGGSKRLPRKNLKVLANKPLIAWTIEAALHSLYIDRVVLSSDDDEIMETAHQWGCEVPFRRPNSLATDEATSADVIHHAINQIQGFDYVVLLQPTSPLRSTEDIDQTLDLCVRMGAPSAVTVTPTQKRPKLLYYPAQNHKMIPCLPESTLIAENQNPRDAFLLNGAVYVIQNQWFQKSGRFIDKDTVFHVMPESRSVDIDSISDFLYADFLLQNRKIDQ